MSFLFVKTNNDGEDLKFGYLKTDDSLKPIENNVLSFSKNSNLITDLLTDPDNGIFGWSIYKDCKLILDKYKEIGEKPFDFQCFDVRYMLNVISMESEEFELTRFVPLNKQKSRYEDPLLDECYLILLAFKNMLYALNENVSSFLERHDFDSCFYYSLDAYYGKKGIDNTVPSKVMKLKSIFEKGIESFVFFDFECANCFNQVGKICEVGIVITDTSFNIKQEIHYPINPNSKFNLLSRSGIGLHLYWEANNYEVYRNAPSLPYYYDSLCAILNDEHSLCFGHSVHNDLSFLETDSERNSLPRFMGYAVDTQKMYMYLVDKQMSSISLENAYKNLLGEEEMSKYTAHKSLDDSKMTMEIAKKMLEDNSMSISTFLFKNPKCLRETSKKPNEVKIVDEYNFPEPNCNKHIDLANPENLYCGIYCETPNERLYYEAVVEDAGKAKMSAFNGRKYAIPLESRLVSYEELAKTMADIRSKGGVILGPSDSVESNFTVINEDGKLTYRNHVPLSSKKRKNKIATTKPSSF